MEKRISFRDFQSVRAVAKAIDPHLRTVATLQRKVLALKAEYDEKKDRLQKEFEKKAEKFKDAYDACFTQINALEAGILQVTGFHVSDLVKKVVEPTGKTDKEGKPLKDTKYLPTDIVSYDDTTKEYVITIPDEEGVNTPPSTENVAGSDFDRDVEALENGENESEETLEESSEDNAEENFPWQDND